MPAVAVPVLTPMPGGLWSQFNEVKPDGQDAVTELSITFNA